MLYGYMTLVVFLGGKCFMDACVFKLLKERM